MTIFSRYLIRNVFIGFAAAAGLLIPLFTTFTLINELEDVAPGRLPLAAGAAGDRADPAAQPGRSGAVYRAARRHRRARGSCPKPWN